MTPTKHSNSNKFIGQYQANERTFLAWVRTGIALMGFGFVIVKFSLFLKQMAIMMENEATKPKSFSGHAGIFMVAAGVIITFLAYIQYRKIDRQICNQDYNNNSSLTLFITLIMTLGGIALTIYLISSL